MKDSISPANDLVTALAYQRQSLLRHAASVMSSNLQNPPPASEREVQLSAITLSALEELKVAEEELMERGAALSALRGDIERRVLTARQLFELAPANLLVTNMYGTILEANRAMCRLMRMELKDLVRQPLARFIPRDARRAFRDGLARIALADGVTDWRMVLVRPTDSPVDVGAVVDVVQGAQTPSGTTLHWSFTLMADSAARPGESRGLM